MHSKSSASLIQAISLIEEKTKQSFEPMTREIVLFYGKNPYLILVSCLLSLQNRDVVTLPVAQKLFSIARTPEQITNLSIHELENTIRSVNYFKTKAVRIHEISRIIIEKYGGRVPNTKNELMSLKGVGIKTANLVLAEAFDIPAICVDTHVHRLSNHWGLVSTQTPAQTEVALHKVLPQQYWITWNYLLVKWGQSICKTTRCKTPDCAIIAKLLLQEEAAKDQVAD